MRMRIDGKKRNADMLVEVEKEMDSSSLKMKE